MRGTTGARLSMALACVLMYGTLAESVASGQQIRAVPGGTRKVATVDALVTYPLFFHSQPVRVRATAQEQDGLYRLLGEGGTVWLLPGQSGSLPDAGSLVEITGTFFDVGRLEPTDTPVSTDFGTLSRRALNREWPAPGDLLVVLIDAVTPAESLAAPSVRTLALDPERYVDQEVTVVGRFRGRNLYGDLPDAPGKSRWDFVLQSADAAVWVTGRRPRGNGFDLDVDNRVDTGRWLEVAGTVRYERGLVRVEATSIREAEPPAQSAPEAVVKVPVATPPPEVVFSMPTQDEIDVEPTAPVRIQFSRDIRPESVKGQVDVSYVGVNTPVPEFTMNYDGGRRVLEIRFKEALEPYRTVQVVLKPGITGTDGQPLQPYTLTFSVGS
ncbi:MAG TPA: Ig-like domain-containing protein [Vicinamibacterales bacterium]